MEQIYIASWDSGSSTYQGFGTTPEEARSAAFAGYSRMCKRMSGIPPDTEHKIIFLDEIRIEEVKIGRCLVDIGRQGWL